MQLPRGFISKAFELIRAKGGLCILDEVRTSKGISSLNPSLRFKQDSVAWALIFGVLKPPAASRT